MNIYLTNKSTAIDNAEVQSWVPAFNRFIYHVRQSWPRPANLIYTDLEPEEAWKVIIADKSDQAGALGYHDFTPGGRPISYVFAEDDISNGYSVTVTATHEIAEMIADPWISELFQVSDRYNYAKEICDPVEEDLLGFEITAGGFKPVLCSDFVLPNWFIPGSTGQFDYADHVTKPLELLAGGYMSVQAAGSWKQIYAEKTGQGREVTADEIKAKGGFGRLERYSRPRSDSSFDLGF